MPLNTLSHFVLLPELVLERTLKTGPMHCRLVCSKSPRLEVCPRCATPSEITYDHRWVRLKDAPIRGDRVTLLVRKRRLWCKPCGKPFTEPLPGVRKGFRHTERYGRTLRWACDRFTDLKSVRRDFGCSAGFLYKTYYHHLELRRRQRLNPWPTSIGVDEHSFGRHPETRQTRFASVIVDYNHKRVMEVVDGKTSASLQEALKEIPGRENVRNVCLDLCDPFKNFARSYFPNANLVADKFHVLRLLSPALLKKRKEIAGNRTDLRAKKLLLMSSFKLGYFERRAIHDFLSRYPEMHELYQWKERLHGFYRIKGYNRACIAHQHMTDAMAHSNLPEIKTLRRTLMKWKTEILNYFKTGLTNARTEGFNNKASVVKRRGYGYRRFESYRLRLLDACA